VGAVSRRSLLRNAIKGVIVGAIAAPFVLRHSYRVFAQSTQEYPERVVRLIRESLVIDMLNQFLYRQDQKDLLEKWLIVPGAFAENDFLKFKSSGVSVINFGQGEDRFADARVSLGKWNSFIAQYPQWLLRINNPADLQKAKDQGKLGIIYGFQTSGQFETLENVNQCYGLGLRASQLSYNFRSLVADGAFEPWPRQRQDQARRTGNLKGSRHPVARQLPRIDSRRLAGDNRRSNPKARRQRRSHGHYRYSVHGEGN